MAVNSVAVIIFPRTSLHILFFKKRFKYTLWCLTTPVPCDGCEFWSELHIRRRASKLDLPRMPHFAYIRWVDS